MDKKCKLTITKGTKQRLDVHMLRMRKKYPEWPGKITRDDAVADLLDEEEKRA